MTLTFFRSATPKPFPISSFKCFSSIAASKSYQNESDLSKNSQTTRFAIETYGCQMNLSDSEIVRSVLLSAGFKEADSYEAANFVLLNTCAIRENAENKIWERLKFLRSVGRKRRLVSSRLTRGMGIEPELHSLKPFPDLKVGLLGCMAERLKDKLLDGDLVDLVAGPDSYRDISKLVNMVIDGDNKKAVNVQLSLDETYEDLKAVRKGNAVDAFVSVMRGCNNMCSYCIVPFTRGRERSRSLGTIVGEVKQLSFEGIKEITLLGQNVNSYHDKSTIGQNHFEYSTAVGFENMYKTRGGKGAYFADLLEAVAEVDPEMRIRFTSPHPKDFSDSVLKAIASRHNVCSQLHLPAQSGSSNVLKAMRRGYTREAYLDLVDHVRACVPNVCLSSDFIAGFCGESEEDHSDTLSLIKSVEYDQAFMYAYSVREKTHAARNYSDDVPSDIKQRRLSEIIAEFRRGALNRNIKNELNKIRVVLVEGESRKSRENNLLMTGRTDGNKRVVFPANVQVPASLDRCSPDSEVKVVPKIGDYIAVLITEVSGHTLQGVPLARTTLCEFSRKEFSHENERLREKN